VITSGSVGGDDGAFYFPYILDPQSASAMLVGTCRVWRGARSGGAYTVLGPNFDTLGAGTCSGSEVNLVQALAAGGPTDSNGSLVVYATTSGLGPLDGPLTLPVGGNVWVTTNATAGVNSFSNVTNNGPQGSINPNQFPVSSVAMDSSDATGATAYVTVMGFTGGTGHVWKTTNFGAAWTDFTANLPDSPVNAVVVDSVNGVVYVGSDVGVFFSSTSAANWTELGPNPSSSQSGFLPNVAVTALGLFNSGGQELLRASTYGRGMWQYPVAATPDYTLSVSNSPLTEIAGQTATFNGSAGSVNGYASSVSLSCVAGTTAPPNPCTVAPATLMPGSGAVFTVTVNAPTGVYDFNVQGVGSDTNHVTHLLPVALNVVSFGLTTPAPATVTVPRGTMSSLVDFQVTAAGSFSQSVTVSCTVPIVNAVCTLTPATSVNPTSANPVNMTASVAVPASTATGHYIVTIQATTVGTSAALSTAFSLDVTTNPDFALSESSEFPEVNAGSTGTNGPILISALDGFSGTVNLSCANTFGANSCGISPTTVSLFPAVAALTINGSSFAAGAYSLVITGASGSDTHTMTVPFNVGDYSISGTQSLALAPGGQGAANLTLTATNFYSGNVNVTCDASALTGAQCVISPPGPITVPSDGTASFIVTINVPNDAITGAYNITINTQDTTGAPSHSFTEALTVSQDFLITSTTPSQTVTPGQTTGPYNLTIQPVGTTFNAPVTLVCTGLPQYSQCAFDPSAPVTPGTSAASVVMTISTTASTADQRRAAGRRTVLLGVGLLLPGVVIGCGLVGRRKRKRLAVSASAILLLVLLPACSGVSNGGGGGGGGQTTPPGSYTITVTGTSPGAPPDGGQSTQVMLVVN
jgi:hypothetical protein